MAMVNLILFIFTMVTIYHGEVLPQKPSKQSRFRAISVRAIIFELDYIFFTFCGNWVISWMSYWRRDGDGDLILLLYQLPSTIIGYTVIYHWFHCQWYIDSIGSTATLVEECFGAGWQKSMCCEYVPYEKHRCYLRQPPTTTSETWWWWHGWQKRITTL